MSNKTDARERAIAAAIRLFRQQGYTATGLSQILAESGAPKGSFYFHFPRGKAQLAEQAIDQYVAARMTVIGDLAAATPGDAIAFAQSLCASFAADMVASDFQYGCLMQNLANELPSLDPDLTQRVAEGFADSTAIIAAHLQGCGFTAADAATAAASLVAGLEGGRTIARLERSLAIFTALAEMTARQWAEQAGTAGHR